MGLTHLEGFSLSWNESLLLLVYVPGFAIGLNVDFGVFGVVAIWRRSVGHVCGDDHIWMCLDMCGVVMVRDG